MFRIEHTEKKRIIKVAKQSFCFVDMQMDSPDPTFISTERYVICINYSKEKNILFFIVIDIFDVFLFINFSSSQQQLDNVVSYHQLNEMVESTTLTTKNGSSINNNNNNKSK